MRKKKMRRGLSLVLAVLIAGVCLLSGCGAKKRAAQEDAETIQVYLWNTTLYENYAPLYPVAAAGREHRVHRRQQ